MIRREVNDPLCLFHKNWMRTFHFAWNSKDQRARLLHRVLVRMDVSFEVLISLGTCVDATKNFLLQLHLPLELIIKVTMAKIIWMLLMPGLWKLEMAEAVKVIHRNGLIQFPLVPHAANLERRRHLLQDDAIQLDALYQGYGTHYMDLWVGTPPQRQTLIVSTDSHIAGFPCSECLGCGGHTDGSFDERLSSTFEKVSCNACETGTRCKLGTDFCDMHVSYAEGSAWYAYEAYDEVYAGGPHDKPLLQDDNGSSDLDPDHAVAFAFRFLFGCETKVTGLFATQLADGILGMNQNSASMWAQMYKENILTSQSFSLCFVRQPR